MISLMRRRYLYPNVNCSFISLPFQNISSSCAHRVDNTYQQWQPKRLTFLLSNLESSLQNLQLRESWAAFWEFKNQYGYPKSHTVVKLLTELANSGEPLWIRKARKLALNISKENPGLLGVSDASRLALIFSRAQIPEAAAVMMRLSFARGNIPYLDLLRVVFMHLTQSKNGVCLASNVLAEMCAMRLKGKPNAVLFNLVLDTCVRYSEPIRGQHIVELMAKAGVVADAHTFVLISRIYEMNQQRDEMKNLLFALHKLPSELLSHYTEFYDILLGMHFNFCDFDAAAELMKNMLSYHDFIPRLNNHPEKTFLVPIGSQNLRDGLKLQVAPYALPKEYVIRIEPRQKFICFRDGKLFPSIQAFAKLLLLCKQQNRIAHLSKFLLEIQQDYDAKMGSCLCSDVIISLVQFGWLNEAHDILEDAVTAGVSLPQSTLQELLKAYEERKMTKQAEALMKQIKSAAFSASSSCHFGVLLSKSMRKFEGGEQSVADDLNSSIYFFCKAKMVGDAVKTYRRMQEMKVNPAMQTYAYLARCFASLGKMRNVTIVWGDMKRQIVSGNLVVSRDMYEMFLLCFVEGGYFERVMEVIAFMKERGMFIDKMMVRNEFLRRYKNLYRNLKEIEAKTDAQRSRLRFVKMFRKWAGIH